MGLTPNNPNKIFILSFYKIKKKKKAIVNKREKVKVEKDKKGGPHGDQDVLEN